MHSAVHARNFLGVCKRKSGSSGSASFGRVFAYPLSCFFLIAIKLPKIDQFFNTWSKLNGPIFGSAQIIEF